MLTNEQRDNLIIYLNRLEDEEKTKYWIDNQANCVYKSSDKDGDLEYNWYYFKSKRVWMCRVYDYEQAKNGGGFLRQLAFTKEKEDLKQINKQWNVL